MVLEIKKNTSVEDVRSILRKTKNRRKKKSSMTTFFGKLPAIEDGLKYQKKIRNEWK
jgi:hypothetical protein